MSETELRLTDINVRFGSRVAAENVSFEVARGEFLAVLGPSGSGKSTLLKLLGGQQVPDSGEIVLGGESIVGLPPNRIDCATVFQDYALFPHMTVGQNVEFGLRMRKWKPAARRERAREMLSLLGMSEFEHRPVTRLSGGERQRVATARALAVSPRLLLMDEPLGALDRLIKLRVQREISALVHKIGVTTVYVTHDQREALTMADRVAVMHNGRLEQVAPPVELLRNPANRFVAEFLGGSGNYFEGTVRSEANGDGLITVDSPLGQVRARPHGIAATVGARLTIHVRPEEVDVVPDSTGSWEVENVAYTGEVAEVRARHDDGQVLMVKQLGVSRLQPADRVRVVTDDGMPVVIPQPKEASEPVAVR